MFIRKMPSGVWFPLAISLLLACLIQPSMQGIIGNFFSGMADLITNPQNAASSFADAADGILKGIKEKITDSSEAFATISGKKVPVSYRFKTDNDHRMAEVFYSNVSGTQKVIDCYLYGDKTMIKYALKFIPSSMVDTVSHEEMTDVINQCNYLYQPGKNESIHITTGGIPVYSQIRKLFQYLVIFPGTKWCGAGDVSSNYDDLGPASETDKCCRHHDHCNRSIAAFSSNFTLTNKGFYTKSHCDCDEAFHKCLLEAKQFVSFTVGKMFFDLLKTQCFRKDHPQSKCKRYRYLPVPILQGNCLQYELDERKPKVWQFFDSPGFDSFINLLKKDSNDTSEEASTEDNKYREEEPTTKKSFLDKINPFG